MVFGLDRLKISQKLPALLIASALVVGGGVGAVAYLVASETVTEQAETKLSAIADASNREIANFFDSVKRDVVSTASSTTTVDAVKQFASTWAAWAELADAGTQLQEAYVTSNPNPVGERYLLDVAKSADISDTNSLYYNMHHERFHPGYRAQMEQQGYSDIEALKLANEDGPYAIGLTLGLSACPIALWSGLDTEAEALTRELLDKSDRYGLAVWHHWGRLFDMTLAARRGDVPARVVPTMTLQSDTLTTFDPLFSTDESLAGAESRAAGWAAPELLRAAAVRLLRSAREDRRERIKALLEESLVLANERGALAWELRAATTMAEVHLAAADEPKARAVLEPVYERLTEGHGTSDALRARDLLEGRSRRQASRSHHADDTRGFPPPSRHRSVKADRQLSGLRQGGLNVRNGAHC